MSLSEWIIEELEAREWSQSDLARKLGITRAAVNNLVNGRSKVPSDDTIEKLATVFGVSKETVYRHAKKLPTEDAETTQSKALVHIANQLEEEDISELIDIAKLKLRRRTDASRKIDPKKAASY